MTSNALSPQKIDLNRANAAALAELPGIGSILADRIVRYREEVQPFEEASELIAVSGISEDMYRQIADLVMVSAVDEGSEEDAAEATPAILDALDDAREADVNASEPEPTEMLKTAEAGIEDAESAPEELPGNEAEEEEEGYIILDGDEEAEDVKPWAKDTKPIQPEPVENGATGDAFKAASAAGSFRRSWLLMVAASLLGAFIALAAMYALNNGSLVTATHPKIVAFEANIAALEEREAALDGKIAELEDKLSEYDALKNRLKKAEAEVEILKQARDTLVEDVSALEGQGNALEKQTAALEKQASALEKQLAALEQDARQMQETINQLQQAAGRFDNFLIGLSELLSTVQKPSMASPSTGNEPTAQPTGTVAPTPQATSDSTAAPTKSPTKSPTEAPTPTPGS